MSLPFLKQRKEASLIIAQRKPDGSKEELHSEGDEDHGLMACAEDLIRAIHAKDAQSTTQALKAIFDIMESKEENSKDSDEQSGESSTYNPMD